MQTIPSFKTNFEPIITNYETITNSDTLKQLEDNKTTTK